MFLMVFVFLCVFGDLGAKPKPREEEEWEEME